MTETAAREQFRSLITDIVSFIGARALGSALQEALNQRFPAQGQVYASLLGTCKTAIAEGWMCAREAEGIRYGRVFKPQDLGGYSVDVVDMHDMQGPHHRHPKGEIDLIMPLTVGATFDDHEAGWLVYEPQSAHYPTVSGGQALVLYLLPQGAIEFTR